MTTPSSSISPNLSKMLHASPLEALFYTQIEQAGLCLPFCQYKVNGHKVDFGWELRRLPTLPDLNIIVEIDGGTWLKGGGAHNRAKGYAADRMRDNRYQLDGWTVLRFTGEHVNSGEALEMMREVLTR